MNLGLITDSWRLKLIAFGLAVLILGVLAFSQNQPTTRSLAVGLNYTVPVSEAALQRGPERRLRARACRL